MHIEKFRKSGGIFCHKTLEYSNYCWPEKLFENQVADATYVLLC